MLVHRDTGEKTAVPMDGLESAVTDLLDDVQKGLYQRAQRFVDENTRFAEDYDSFKETIESHRGFIDAPWCGDSACEAAIKEETGVTIRCLPLGRPSKPGKCIRCGKDADTWVYFARAY
ncbi:MAG: Proline--tRNA ligase [Firmicutes bacterium ADurb.Bin506]|nr:MAG: Proline--tRNA ligase [Firmicutes bacterium ADurb.Bin506]